MLKKRRFWIAATLAAVLSYMAWSRQEITFLHQHLKGYHSGYLTLTIALALLVFWIKAYSWYLLVRPFKKDTGLNRLFSSLMIGYGVEVALNIRLREIYRAFAATQVDGLKFFSSLGSVLLGRAIEAAVLSLNILLVTGFYITLPADNTWSVKLAWASGFAALFTLGVMYVLRDEKSPINDAVKKILRWLLEDKYSQGAVYYSEFLKGISAVSHWRPILAVFFLAILARIITAGYYWSLGQTIGVDLAPSSSIFLTGVASLRVLIPQPYLYSQTPQFHNLLSWNLNSLFHMDMIKADTYSHALPLLIASLTAGVGLFLLFLEGFRVRKAQRR